MNLRGRKARAVGIDHRFDHVLDKSSQFGVRKIRDGLGRLTQHRMAHTRDFSDRHEGYMTALPGLAKGGQRRTPLVSPRPNWRAALTTALPGFVWMVRSETSFADYRA